MRDNNSFLVQNKVITIEQIKEITEYLKKTLDYYSGLIKQELEENNNANFVSGHYKHYAYIKPSLEFKVEFNDGRKIDTKDDFVFYDALKEPQFIYKISERLYISYSDNESGETTDHLMDISLDFSESVISFVTSNKNMNEELYNISSYINGLLNGGEDRFSKIIKNRFLVKNLIGLTAGSILTLIAFIIIVLTKSNTNPTLSMLFNNPILLFLGGWLIAFALGNTIVSSIVNGLYNGIEQGLEYATNKGTYTSHYEDNYRMFNEVLIGKNYNNLEKRKSIEKIYSISKKVLLVRLLISITILVILSFM